MPGYGMYGVETPLQRTLRLRQAAAASPSTPAPPPAVGPGGVPVPGGGLSGAHRGPGEAASRYLQGYLLPQETYRAERQGRANERYDAALADPTGTADLFGKYFQDAAQGFAAPAMRDFRNEVAGVQANTAARFGGNASTAEEKNIYNTSDLFSRNLSEAIARLAPQAAGMGLDYTRMLGGAAEQATSERDRLSQLELQGIGMYPQKQKKGSPLGALVGASIGFATGGPAGAAAGAYRGYSGGGG